MNSDFDYRVLHVIFPDTTPVSVMSEGGSLIDWPTLSGPAECGVTLGCVSPITAVEMVRSPDVIQIDPLMVVVL